MAVGQSYFYPQDSLTSEIQGTIRSLMGFGADALAASNPAQGWSMGWFQGKGSAKAPFLGLDEMVMGVSEGAGTLP